MKFVRKNEGLPLTGLVIREEKSIADTDRYIVLEYGFTKPTFWQACECSDYEPSEFMQKQLNDWLVLSGNKEKFNFK